MDVEGRWSKEEWGGAWEVARLRGESGRKNGEGVAEAEL